MAGKKQKLSFKIKLAIPGTKDLTPPNLECECNIEMDTDEDHERALWAYYQKHFEKKLKEKLEAQVKNFGVPLQSMQKKIDSMRSAYEAVTASKNMAELAKQCKSQTALDLAGKMNDELKSYNNYLKDAVKHTGQQQFNIWHTAFEKEAESAAVKKIKGEIKWKKRKAVLGLVVKGTLVLGAAGLAIAASIATFGTLPATLGVISVTCAGLGGLKAVYQTYKKYQDATNLEAAALKKIEADLKDISIHLGKTSSTTQGLPKHLDDASRFHTVRREALQEAEKKISNTDKELVTIRAELKKIAGVKGLELDAGALVTQIAGLEKDKMQAVAKIKNCMKRDEELNKIFNKAKELVGDLQKLDFNGPKSLMENISKQGFDGAVNAIDLVNTFVNSATSFAGAIK